MRRFVQRSTDSVVHGRKVGLEVVQGGARESDSVVLLAVADSEHVVAGDVGAEGCFLQVVAGRAIAIEAVHHRAGVVFVLERLEFGEVVVNGDLVGHDGDDSA